MIRIIAIFLAIGIVTGLGQAQSSFAADSINTVQESTKAKPKKNKRRRRKRSTKKALRVPNKPKKQEKVKIDVDGFLNLGMGLSQYTWKDVYDGPIDDEAARNALTFGTELDISVVAPRETLQKFRHKVPKKFLKHFDNMDGLSVSHFFVPNTLYIQPKNNNREAYGISWDWTLGASLGPRLLHLGVSGGFVFTYMFFRDYRYDDPIHFIRPGLRGNIYLGSQIFKYLGFQVGTKGDIYWPQKFYSDENKVWNATNVYAMFHVRFPFTTTVEL